MAEQTNNGINSTLTSLFKGMDGIVTSKTVVGDPITFGDTILLPLVDISFGMAAGAFSKEKGKNAGGGIGGRINPSCVLVIQGEKIRLVNIRNQDSVTKIIDLVPEIADKILSAVKKKKQSPEETAKKEEAAEVLSEMLEDAFNQEPQAAPAED